MESSHVTENVVRPLNVLFLENGDPFGIKPFIDSDKFIVYHGELHPDYEPSANETALIASSRIVDMKSVVGRKLLNYFKAGGNVICPLAQNTSLNSLRGICSQQNDGYSKFWIKQLSCWINPSKIGADQFFQANFPSLCRLCTSNKPELTEATAFFSSSAMTGTVPQSRLMLDFDSANKVSDSYLPICTSKKSNTFNWNEYKTKLTTEYLGQNILHVEVINSTFDVLDGPKELRHGLAVIADIQLKGRGRGQNVWISNYGCAMTSFQLVTSMKSALGQKASLLQHLVSLAVVHSLQEHIALKIKWPNDIYYGSKVKMGGVVAYSSICNEKLCFNVGFGFNLANSQPTLCLNDLLQKDGRPLLSREVFLANVFNTLEEFIRDLESDNGLAKILRLYHSYWLHENQPVSVINHSGDSLQGIVESIDKDGFLRVKLLSSAKVVTVHPGNNSFDMMQGLILPKSE